MRIPSGSTNRYIYFVAVDATDLKTRETSLTGWTVYASLNGGTAGAFTTPTVNETDSTNMPGVYELLLDEYTTLTAGRDTEELCLHIEDGSSAMAPVTRVVEIYRPETTEGNTLDVTSTGAGGVDWGNVENQSTSVDLSATATNLVDTATAVTNQVTANMTAISGDTTAADNLEESATAIVATSVNDASATTTSFIITSTEATDDHFNGRALIFTSGNLINQATRISDYTGSTKTVTVDTLTEAPGNGDTFVIV